MLHLEERSVEEIHALTGRFRIASPELQTKHRALLGTRVEIKRIRKTPQRADAAAERARRGMPIARAQRWILKPRPAIDRQQLES